MAQGHQDVGPGTPPLAGIRVIERTNLLSCRLAGLLLADQGAPRSSWTAPRPTLAADQHAGLDNGYFDRGKIALPEGVAADAACVDIVIVDGTAEFARRPYAGAPTPIDANCSRPPEFGLIPCMTMRNGRSEISRPRLRRAQPFFSGRRLDRIRPPSQSPIEAPPP